MTFCCFRGDTQLSDEDLQVHLASAFRLENIGALIGAGGSVCAGGKTIKQLWLEFIEEEAETAEVLALYNFIEEEEANPQTFHGDQAKQPPNIEELLDALEIALIEAKRVGQQGDLYDLLNNASNCLLRYITKAAILNDECWSNIQSPKHFPSHAEFMQKLIGARQPGQPSPWVFTTNYDLAFEWAAEESGILLNTGFSGIHSRRFSPQVFDLGVHNAKASGEARFGCNDIYLGKLHGSLTWKRHGSEFIEHASSSVWSELRGFIDGEQNLSNELMVYPRAAKYRQTNGYISGELFRRLSDFLAKPQGCLIVTGFSFGDGHINRLIRSALTNPTLQLIVFVPEFTGLGDEELNKLKPELKSLAKVRSPRVTLVGGDQALFQNLVSYLPSPALFDSREQELRERIKSISGNDGGNHED